MKDEIIWAIDQYTHLRGNKRGFLLTPGNAYFLYDNRFCEISEYQIRLQSQHYHINSSQLEQPLFWGLSGERLLCAATSTQQLEPQALRLVFHVPCGDEPGGLLRGICFVKDTRAYLSLFSDESIETLLLAVETETAARRLSAPPHQDIAEVWQKNNLDRLRLLTALYISSQPLDTAESIQKLMGKSLCNLDHQKAEES